MNGLDTLFEDYLTVIIMISFWESLFYSTGLCLSMPVPHCFHYCSFVAYFEIRKYETSNFVFFYQESIDYLRFSCFVFKCSFSICKADRLEAAFMKSGLVKQEKEIYSMGVVIHGI